MRVGTRRLRSCLSLMEPFGPRALLGPVIAEVKWLAGLLGKARDWDVFVTETLPPLAAWFARDANTAPGIKRLRERAARRRRAARNDARASGGLAPLPSPSARRGFALRDTAARRNERCERSLPAMPSERASAFAAKLLARRHRKFADLAATLAHAGNDERHAARIAAKRLRYVAEFFAPLLPRQAHPNLSRDACRDTGRARPVQRCRDRRHARGRAVRIRRPRGRRCGARLGRRASRRHRASSCESLAAIQCREAVLAAQIGESGMLESAETGHRIAKKDYAREEPKLREPLLNAQYDLSNPGAGPCS